MPSELDLFFLLSAVGNLLYSSCHNWVYEVRCHTRELLRGTAQDGIDDAVDRGKTVIRRVRKNIGDAKDFVSEVANTAEGAFREARNALS